LKILITGATGFIGTYLIKHLDKKEYKITGLSRNKNNKTIKKIDLNNKLLLNDFFKKNKFDIVIHLGFTINDISPSRTFDENCLPTVNLLECCIDNKIKKFIFASSHMVYGKTTYLPIDELHPKNPEDNYSISKLILENFCKMYSISHGIDMIILRISSVYGPEQLDGLVITNLMKSCLNNKQMTVFKYKNGFQTMDLIHVKDVCQSIECAINSRVKYGIFNIASGKQITAYDIAKEISKISGISKIIIKKINQNTNHFLYDISNTQKKIKFKSKIKINKKILKPWFEQYVLNSSHKD